MLGGDPDHGRRPPHRGTGRGVVPLDRPGRAPRRRDHDRPARGDLHHRGRGRARRRGDVAFAQAIIETGSFGQTLGNNYAGIGNCDCCNGQGITFPTPQDGVRAQIQLLRSYADPGSRAALPAAPSRAGALGGSPAAAAASYDSFAYKGSAPVWNVMGNGKWATDPDYSIKILDIYARMVGFAATAR